MISCDRFKTVNDIWGHPAGDEVIRQVSSALQQGLRPADALSGMGGEEIAALLRDASMDEVKQIAERLRAEIASLDSLPGGAPTTISIGVARSHLEETSEELLRRCDLALYRSTQGGRNRVSPSRGSEGQRSIGKNLDDCEVVRNG